VGDSVGSQKDQGKSSDRKAKRFYRLGQPLVNAESSAGLECLNRDEVFSGPPSPFQPGFHAFTVRPRFRFRIPKRRGRKPYDVEFHYGYWLVSDRAKQLFDKICEADFAYLTVDTEVDPASEPATYWLCDIVSLVDALDESRSVVEREILRDGSIYHPPTNQRSLAVDENRVGVHSVFRMKTSFTTLICNERFRTEFKQSKLTGLSFQETFEPPFDKVGTVTALPPPNGVRYGGIIKPEGRSAIVYFSEDILKDLDGPLKIGETVRVIGRKSKYGGYFATRIDRCRAS